MNKITLLSTVFIAATFAQTSDTHQGVATHYAGDLTGAMPWFYNSTPARYGWTDRLFVGDTYHIQVAGEPYSAITVVRWQNGYPNTTLNFNCDANGWWIYDGVVQPSEVGFWTETWTVDGEIFPMLELTIWPQGWDGSTPTVYFQNLTTGNNTFLTVGDQYKFIWVGPAYATMLKNGTFNGATLTYPSAWQLGAGGFTVYQGTALASEVGTWTESWTFNGQPPNTLHFVVFPQ